MPTGCDVFTEKAAHDYEDLPEEAARSVTATYYAR
jgi:hypothetical protein